MDTQKPRLLISIQNLNGGGAERVALDLAKAINRDKFDVTVFVHEKVGSLINILDPKSKIIFHNEVPYNRSHLPGLLVKTIKLARNADLLIGANEGRASFFMLVASIILKKPIICWIHSNWVQFSKVTSWRQSFSLQTYDFAERIVSCSQGVADAFRTLVKIKPNKIQRIFNGIPLSSIQQQAKLSIDPAHEHIFNKPTVLTAGRLDYPKGHEYLVEAHALLLKMGFDHNLVILGGGPEQGARQLQIEKLGVNNSAYLLGFQKNPFAYMRRATTFALSSRFEGFALVVAEAMTCGTPVVSVDCPSGPREVLDEGKCGILVKTENSQALAEGLKEMLTNDNLREQFTKRSLERCKVFDLKDITKEWESLFSEILEKK